MRKSMTDAPTQHFSLAQPTPFVTLIENQLTQLGTFLRNRLTPAKKSRMHEESCLSDWQKNMHTVSHYWQSVQTSTFQKCRHPHKASCKSYQRELIQPPWKWYMLHELSNRHASAFRCPGAVIQFFLDAQTQWVSAHMCNIIAIVALVHVSVACKCCIAAQYFIEKWPICKVKKPFWSQKDNV